MRIVTWNMGNRKGAWDYLLEVIRPDFALLQEAQVIGERPGYVRWQAVGRNSVKYGEKGRYRWGSAVWSREHELDEVGVSTNQGWIQAARPLGTEPLTLISMHVELDQAGSSIPILHRMLSDLTPILEASSQVILGGDLNADVSFDEKYRTRRHSIAFERIGDLGLWHCNRLIPPGRRGTFRRDASVMDDHLFVGRSMANRVVSCRVLIDEQAPSDHFPVELELEPV
jgi:endonuclease/exonuclease/phosphatase family metal-dependent hydrolase